MGMLPAILTNSSVSREEGPDWFDLPRRYVFKNSTLGLGYYPDEAQRGVAPSQGRMGEEARAHARAFFASQEAQKARQREERQREDAFMERVLPERQRQEEEERREQDARVRAWREEEEDRVAAQLGARLFRAEAERRQEAERKQSETKFLRQTQEDLAKESWLERRRGGPLSAVQEIQAVLRQMGANDSGAWFWGLAADLQELGKNVLPGRASGDPATRAHLPVRELIWRAPAGDKAAVKCRNGTLELLLPKTSLICNFLEAAQTAVNPKP